MNIGIFTNNYLPNPYGVTQSIESFRKQFEKKGHAVFIFAPHWPDYVDTNPHVFRYPSVDIKIKFRFPLAIPYSRKMNKIIEQLDLDIIHAQHPNLLGTAAKTWARKKSASRRIPLVFTWHTLYDQYAHFIPLVPQKWAAGYIIKKAVNYANQCDQIIVPTESVRGIIQKWGVVNENIAAIPSGIEEEAYSDPDGGAIRQKHGIKSEEILLLLVSRLTEEKNVEFLFRALTKILQGRNLSPFGKGSTLEAGEGFDEPDKVFKSPPTPLFQRGRYKIKFLVAGGGYLLEKLKKFAVENSISDKIVLAGVVDKAVLKHYYAAADIFVYASKSETQGMIITEAMYAGLPIVAMNATGICDLVEDNVNGFLVDDDAESEEKFSDAVNKLINDKELRERFGAASARGAREKYTSEICADKMLAVYKNVIERRKSEN